LDGSSRSSGGGASIYQVRRGLHCLSIKRRPADALKCSDGIRAQQRAIAAYHTLPLLLISTRGGFVYKAL